jgi:hypothetical protein
MRHVAHLVAVAQPDDRRKVVLDDAEVIAVVVDVGGQQQRVAPPHDPLLAEIRRQPVDLVHQLVGLHHLGRLGQAFADLREKGHVAVRGRAEVAEPGVGELPGTQARRALDQRAGAGVVPALRAGPSGAEGRQQEHARGACRGEQAIHSRKVAAGLTVDKHARPARTT